MRKELEEVRDVLATISEGDYRYIEGSEMFGDVTQALVTLDGLLGQSEPEMVCRVAEKAGLTDERTKAVLHALGLMKEGD